MGDEPNKGGGARGGLRRGLATLVIILGILWVTAYFALGTKGGHDFVQSQLSKRLGTEVTLERARLAVPAALRLVNVQSADYVTGEAGFRADEVRLALGVRPWFRITLVKPELNLVHDGLAWSPTRFAALGELPDQDIASVADLCAGWRDRMAVAVEDGGCAWLRDGSLVAAARGVRFQIEPVKLPGRDAAFYQRLQAMSVQETDGSQTDNVDVEWLTAGTARYIELARGPTLPAAASGGFWGVGDDTASGY